MKNNNSIICEYRAMSIGENPHWVYGVPFHEPKGNWTMYWIDEYESNHNGNAIPFTNYMDIDANTLCAVSHQIDSNGVRIAINDLVYFPELNGIFILKYDFDFDAFIFVDFYNNGNIFLMNEIKDKTSYTVIGNITQNFDMDSFEKEMRTLLYERK